MNPLPPLTAAETAIIAMASLAVTALGYHATETLVKWSEGRLFDEPGRDQSDGPRACQPETPGSPLTFDGAGQDPRNHNDDAKRRISERHSPPVGSLTHLLK